MGISIIGEGVPPVTADEKYWKERALEAEKKLLVCPKQDAKLLVANWRIKVLSCYGESSSRKEINWIFDLALRSLEG